MGLTFDAGFYVNLFEVSVPQEEILVMIADRSEFPEVNDLRNEIGQNGKEIFVYLSQRRGKVYGVGKDMEWLSSKGFKQSIIKLSDDPSFTSWLIGQGVISKLSMLGYSNFSNNKGRYRTFNKEEFKITSDGNVKIFLGCDIRSIFLRDKVEDKLVFGLILDVCYQLKDIEDNPLSFKDIVFKFGSRALKEVRQIQKDLIPTGINREVSRQRLIEDIIPFIEKIKEIDLPCGLKAEIKPNPTRIILGERK